MPRAIHPPISPSLSSRSLSPLFKDAYVGIRRTNDGGGGVVFVVAVAATILHTHAHKLVYIHQVSEFVLNENFFFQLKQFGIC